MAIDPYSPCPGGTGKKLKFCCSDLLPELEKIQRMLEGDQRAACLDHIESLEGKYPDRACLLSVKAMLQSELGQEQQAQATLARFLEKHPGNPVALAERAALVATTEGAAPAVSLLQDALEKCGDQMPAQVYDAIGLVGQVLLTENQLIAGRAHLVLQLGVGGAKDQRPLELVMRLNASPTIPLLAKQDLALVPAPDDALWKKGFAAALEPALRGCWRLSAGKLQELAFQVGDWPAIWQNIAVLRSWLADSPKAIEAWRKYAAQKIPLEDAVEAEALAQSLDPEALDVVELLSVEYEIADAEVLQARLAANARALAMPTEMLRSAGEDEPPPKAAYWLLDRATPTSAAGLAPQDVPCVAGQAFVFGKQTDRAARLELSAYRTELAAAQQALAEITGDALGKSVAEVVAARVPALQHALTLNWRLPRDVTQEQRVALITQQRRDLLLNRWPEMPQRVLGGKTAAQAAGDASLRIKLLAAILLLELAADRVAPDFDCNELRRKLGLPELGPIDPVQVAPATIPLLRLDRVEVGKLTDEQLVELFRRADHYRHITALRKLALEVLRRPSLEKQVDRAEVYGVLSQIEPDPKQAFAYLDEARKATEAAGKSTATWDLSELAMRIARGEVAEADRLLHHIRSEHIREPGVAQALFEILAEAGIIGPDGKPAVPPAAAEAPGIVVPGATAEPGKIWTPDSDQPTTGKKSTIWTPD